MNYKLIGVIGDGRLSPLAFLPGLQLNERNIMIGTTPRTKEETRLASIEWHRKKRAEHRAKGLCPSCGTIKTLASKKGVCGNKPKSGFRCERCYLRNRGFHAPKAYGISKQEYQSLIPIEPSSCTCCGAVSHLVLDHSHSSGKARGPVCCRCNVILGASAEDVQRLKAVIRYLEKQNPS